MTKYQMDNVSETILIGKRFLSIHQYSFLFFMNKFSVDFASFSCTLKAGCCVKRRRPFYSRDNLTHSTYVSLIQMKTEELYVSVQKQGLPDRIDIAPIDLLLSPFYYYLKYFKKIVEQGSLRHSNVILIIQPMYPIPLCRSKVLIRCIGCLCVRPACTKQFAFLILSCRYD